MADDTPREFGLVNLLTPNDVLACGPRTPWSPVRRWTRSRPEPVVATRLLDLDDDEPELPAENSGRGGATGPPSRQMILNRTFTTEFQCVFDFFYNHVFILYSQFIINVLFN